MYKDAFYHIFRPSKFSSWSVLYPQIRVFLWTDLMEHPYIPTLVKKNTATWHVIPQGNGFTKISWYNKYHSLRFGSFKSFFFLLYSRYVIKIEESSSLTRNTRSAQCLSFWSNFTLMMVSHTGTMLRASTSNSSRVRPMLPTWSQCMQLYSLVGQEIKTKNILNCI
jgi:hypothetical protein